MEENIEMIGYYKMMGDPQTPTFNGISISHWPGLLMLLAHGLHRSKVHKFLSKNSKYLEQERISAISLMVVPINATDP